MTGGSSTRSAPCGESHNPVLCSDSSRRRSLTHGIGVTSGVTVGEPWPKLSRNRPSTLIAILVIDMTEAVSLSAPTLKPLLGVMVAAPAACPCPPADSEKLILALAFWTWKRSLEICWHS